MIEGHIYEYEEILLGRKSRFVTCFNKHNTEKENRRELGIIWNYAITHILKWTPQEAVVYLTDEIVDMLCLDKTFGAINFDRGSSYVQDYSFILQYAFPDEIKYDIKRESIAEYNRVAKLDIWVNDQSSYKYPKKFFLDINGIHRANLLLDYVVSLYMGDMSLEERYDFFSDNKHAAKWLRKKHLELPCKNVYLNDTLDYFHESSYIKDYFLYYTKRVERRISEELINS